MSDKIPGIDRSHYIEYLSRFDTRRTEEYYKKLTDRELIVEYEKLMKWD